MPTQKGAQARIGRVFEAIPMIEGEGMHVRRTIGGPQLSFLDPFLLLDHLGPWDSAPGEAKGAPDHPHRGFETVTYLLEGKWEHKDSQGNKGFLYPGDVQWMTAGDGVVHSEMPAPEIIEKGGRVHGLQLWVNLPKKDKRMPPRYQDIRADRIPEVTLDGGAGRVRVIAGRFQDQEAVADTRTPITYLHAELSPGGKVELPVPGEHNGFVYAIRGSCVAAGKEIKEAHMGLLDGNEGALQVQAGEEGLSLLLVTGKPLQEPVARWGPFVMNTQSEIQEAVHDFQSGRMGEISAEFV